MTRLWMSATVFSLLGICVSVWVEESIKASAPSGAVATAPIWLVLPFFGLYLVATHILAPWDVMRRRCKRVPANVASGEMVVHPWWSWVFLGPLLLGDGRAKVPSLASAFFIWLLCVLCAWLVVILSAMAVG